MSAFASDNLMNKKIFIYNAMDLFFDFSSTSTRYNINGNRNRIDYKVINNSQKKTYTQSIILQLPIK